MGHPACATDVAINYALGFIPGYNALKLGGTLIGLNFNFVQNIISGKSVITVQGPTILGNLAGLADAYRLATPDVLGKVASTAGTIANLANTVSAGYDLYQCYYP